MLAQSVIVYILSFICIWIGSGLIVSSVTKLSHKLHISSFLVSFIILGLLTSTPEIAVGLSAVSSNTPGIFVGNLLGGVLVLFFFVIPLLAIFSGGIKLNHNLGKASILFSLLVSAAPFFAVIDGDVTNIEGVLMVVFYIMMAIMLYRNNKELSTKNITSLKMKNYSLIDILKILTGTAIVLFSSNLIVTKTLYFSEIFNIAPFYISLVVLSFGTNLPELTLAIRSIISGKKDIAFGDYLGSASANTLLFGLFILMTPNPAVAVDSFVAMFVLVVIGFVLFYYFSKTKQAISTIEGITLIIIYIIFAIVEFA